MPNPNDVQLNPPGSWDEFEDICADLFAREWNDPNVVRYGRQGQSQHGVDIHGKENGADVGAQCKRKGNWPPTTLTTVEVDEEVEEAKKFRPKLKKYFIVTTAPNDARIIDHVNAISAKHAKKGLFSVHVYSWNEILRRVRNNPDLLEKHFDIYGYTAAIKNITADNILYRGVPWPERPHRVAELSCRPVAFARLNRANWAGQPMFYGSRGAPPAFYELRAKAGERIALSGWKITQPIWMHNLGFHQDALRKLGGPTVPLLAPFVDRVPNETRENKKCGVRCRGHSPR